MKKVTVLFTIALMLIFNNIIFATSNVALTGVATQSSTYWWYATADKAIDGNTDGDYYHRSVTHTEKDYQAWWQVDLQKDYKIESIVLWNRTDGACALRLSNFNVSVLDNLTYSVWSQDFYTSGGTFNPSLSIDLPEPVLGQYVKVQLNGTNFLHMAEVQVFGTSVNPEPSTFLLLGCSLCVGLIFLRKKKSVK